MVILLLLLSCLNADVAEAAAPPIALPGCQDTCGNVRIPYPFGLGSNCFLDSWYEIECKTVPPSNTSTRPRGGARGSPRGSRDPPSSEKLPRPFLSKLKVEVSEIVLDVGWSTPIQTITVRIPPLKVCTADTQRKRLSGIDLRGSPYNFSTDSYAFVLEGCAGSAALLYQTEAAAPVVACSTVCHDSNNTAISTNKCFGVECCQTELPSTTTTTTTELNVAVNCPLQFYQIDFDVQSFGERQHCLAATLIKSDSLMNQYVGKMLSTNTTTASDLTVPVVLIWSWVSSGWLHYNPNQTNCNHDQSINRTLCACNNGYYGNPYIYDGCQVVEACRRCRGHCEQISNSYHACRSDELFYNVAIILVIISIALGPLLLVFGCCLLHRFIKRRSKTVRRVKVFKLKLQQHQSTSEGVVERTKLFTYKQLDKATNHFNENRVLGKGGQGIVYKGMLHDGRTVAVKKLKMMDESEMEQFINEVVILSQINHINVVKLLGCCLESEVPLLVYEFISNGTLSQHIHHPDEDFVLGWTMRLKIAAGAAGAIAYLHSYSSIPIYHRDIKSANILLDEKYKAKVSDFGSSKTTSIDQTHLTTLVRGTWGYLDPEYFQSNQFTDKSDVYSFGVVLVEILTGKKPIYKNIESMEQKSLVIEFVLKVQNSQLFDILDPQVVNEAKEEELVAVANLAKRCLNDSGRMRPTMREVATTLDMIIQPPLEIPTQYHEEFDNNVMVEMSDVDFMSSPLPASVANSLNIDVQPLMRDTI